MLWCCINGRDVILRVTTALVKFRLYMFNRRDAGFAAGDMTVDDASDNGGNGMYDGVLTTLVHGESHFERSRLERDSEHILYGNIVVLCMLLLLSFLLLNSSSEASLRLPLWVCHMRSIIM